MSAFKAINIESESEPDEEIDDTQEIQIEEALRLYQAALKCHSEGPASFERAAKAYEDLFKSEIFARPETLPDLRDHELYATDSEDELPEDLNAELHNQSATTSEQAPNTLPQIVHLSYKNYGQFLLDALEYKCKEDSDDKPQEGELFTEVAASLRSFVEAISKDEADVDLWRKISILGEIVNSRRLARLSLEAVLGGGTLRRAGLQLLPGPEEWYAEEKQRDLVEDLEDDLALGKIRSTTAYRLSNSLLVKFRPYSDIPRIATTSGAIDDPLPFADHANTQSLKLQKLGWVELGDVVVDSIVSCLKTTSSFVSPRIFIEITDESLPSDFEADTPENELHHENPLTSDPEAKKIPVADTQMANIGDGLHDQSETIERAEQSAPPMATKRSTDSAGLPEAAEGGRSRSKRIRARESIAESATTADTAATDHARESEYLHQLSTEADTILFEIIDGILNKINLSGVGSVQDIKGILGKDVDELLRKEGLVHGTDNLAMVDLFSILQNFTDELAQKLTQREISKQMGDTAQSAQIQAPTSLTKLSKKPPSSSRDLFKNVNLRVICQDINSKSMVAEEASWTYLIHLLGHQSLLNMKIDMMKARESNYLTDQWSSALKLDVMKILLYINDYIYFRISQDITSLETLILSYQDRKMSYSLTSEDSALVELVQSLFELHLDLMTTGIPIDSAILVDGDVLKSHYLNRWARLCQTALSLYFASSDNSGFEGLAVRFVWAFAFYLKVSGGISDWQMISFLQELKHIITATQNPTMRLPNSNLMPELSLDAINEEISALSLKGFFEKVFKDSEMEDPLSLIETLEPVLEYSTLNEALPESVSTTDKENDLSADHVKEHLGNTKKINTVERTSVQEASEFVQKSKLHLRLSLWQRLRKAYDAIEFVPKSVSCRLRILGLFCEEFKSLNYSGLAEERRHELLLGSLGIIDQQVADILLVIKKQPELAFSFIDEALLNNALNATVTIIRLLYVYLVFNERHSLGQPPEVASSQISAALSTKAKIFMQDMQVRIWILFYHLVQEAESQHREAYKNSEEVKFEYLRAVHHAMSVRGSCKHARMSFLKFEKEELLSMPATEQVDVELSQVLYDLYGLKTFTNSAHCAEHDTFTETLDRKVALSILDFILRQAKKISIKDLHRTELKASIDRVNMAVGRQKPNEILVRNRKLYNAYLKSTVNPLDLFRCLGGSGALSMVPVSPQFAPIASKGWYFIMGNLSLNKYRSQKRLTAGPIEELNAAIAFFAQDIEYCANRWESWYRAAQVYDFQIEELVSWSAEKLNSSSSDLLNYQRSAIHCYIMAVACAVRSSHQSIDNKSMMADMYFDFGVRIYASSRPPFGMEAFAFKDNEHRYLSDSTLFKARPFNALHLYTAWKIAAALFKRAVAIKPDNWMSHYMLGKCLWKMHTTAIGDPVGKRAPDAKSVIQALLDAIETLPAKKEKNREPIIEPHYKLASLMHKLVNRGEIKPDEACQTLQASTYASKIPAIENEDNWPEYILQVLKTLRAADKSNWHHRMIARAAHVLLEDEENKGFATIGAKNELSQHIFTKTMTIQVWKPEHERPGRHFVYTSLYALLFIRLLSDTADRANFELLARKVRKKAHDFFKHTIVWIELCTKYLKVLRKVGGIPELNEENIFKTMSYDEFLTRASKLEIWCHSSDESSPLLDILRETVDLKKLNAGLAKISMIDDLIGDIYAALFEQKAPALEDSQSRPSITRGSADTKGEINALSQTPAISEANHHQTILEPRTGVSLNEQQQSRSRSKVIGRREVQRRAEAAATKPPNPAIPLRPPAQMSSQQSQVQVIIEMKTNGGSTGPAEVAGQVAMESSAPASVHDSADDESELSDLEEVAERPLFPGLINRAKAEGDDQQIESLHSSKE